MLRRLPSLRPGLGPLCPALRLAQRRPLFAVPQPCSTAVPRRRDASALSRQHGAVAFLATELSRILGALEAAGVPAYPSRGPPCPSCSTATRRTGSRRTWISWFPGKTRWASSALDALGYRAQGAREVWLAGPPANRVRDVPPAPRRESSRSSCRGRRPAYFGFDHERLGIWSKSSRGRGTGVFLFCPRRRRSWSSASTGEAPLVQVGVGLRWRACSSRRHPRIFDDPSSLRERAA